MEQLHMGVLRLVKSALIGQPFPLPEGFDIEEAYPLLREHQLQPLAYEGAVLNGISRQLPVMKQLFQDYCRALMRSEAQMRAVDTLRTALDEAGVDYLFFKGCHLKELYPKPELRPMGDADVLIPVEHQKRVDTILRQQGYQWKQENEQESLWCSSALAVEPHRSLIKPSDRDFYPYFGVGWQLVKRDESGKAFLSPEDEFAFLFVHMAKHYRGGGIGLRQFIDLWVYRCAVPELDEETLQDIMRRLNLSEFYRNVMRTLAVWFADEPADEKTRVITCFVFGSGSFGTAETRFLSRAVRSSNKGTRTFTAVVQRVFPEYSRMKYEYPILKTKPWLLPFFWLFRLGHIVCFRREKFGKTMSNLRLLRENEAERLERSLRFVGLDMTEI